MKVGDRIKIATDCVDVEKEGSYNQRTPMMLSGTVGYMHPKRRFFRVDYDCGFSECFPITRERND